MRQVSYTYKFSSKVPFAEVLVSLKLAFLAAEGLFGEAVVRMDAGTYLADESGNCLTVDGSADVGHAAVRIFTHFLMKDYGEKAFSITRTE